MLMSEIVFITGATSGIGKATAKMFAAKGHPVIITGRRQSELKALKKELENSFGVAVLELVLDVRNKKEVNKCIIGLDANWSSIGILINNAGLSLGLSPIHEGDTDDWENMIDTNVKGLLYVTRAISPGMVERRSGHIINIGSIAGKETYQNGNVYCATKRAVDALSTGMRIDLLAFGIKVTAIHPGAVETEFSIVRFKGNKDKADAVYKGFKPLVAEDIANAIEYVSHLPSHVNINELIIMPTAQANTNHLLRIQ